MEVKNLPREIGEFFSGPGGKSLIIRGTAGTGKTTLALQLLEELASPDNSFYLSTRVSDEALYNQFPWLKDKEMRTRIVDASRVLLDSFYPEGGAPEYVEDEHVALARDFLQTIHAEEKPARVSRTRLSVLLENNRLPEIERIYDSIEHVLPEKSLLVIDSVEGVTHKYGLDAEDLINTLQKDLVENSNTNLVLVLEKSEAPELEYLVDGVVALSRTLVEQRVVRHIHLLKLRATEIKQHSYLITLQNGRFKSFEPFLPNYSTTKKWSPMPDPEGHYSTGIPDLDNLLNGGYAKGSYNVVEIGENVSSEEYLALLRPLFLNFITQGRGLLALLSGGRHPKNLKDDLVRFLSEEEFNRKVRVVDYFSSKSDEPYVMAVGGKGKEEARRIWMENLNAIRDGGEAAIIDYTGFDTLEYLRGDTIAIKDLFSVVAQTKISKDLGIGVIKPGLKLTQEIMNMADTYLKIIDINKCPCIYGIKPKTIIHAITVDEEKGSPHISLTPIV